jgi:hypothetical protein
MQTFVSQNISGSAAVNNPFYAIDNGFEEHAMTINRVTMRSDSSELRGNITFAPYKQDSVNANKMFVHYVEPGFTLDITGTLTCTIATF